MFIDKELQFSDAQDISQVQATYTSTNVIDLGAPDSPVIGSLLQDFARGNPLPFWAQIIEAVVGNGSSTIQVQVVMADNDALSSNAVVLIESQAIVETDLVAGYLFRLGSLTHGLTKRYLGMKYVVGVATTTAGTISSGIGNPQLDYSVQ